MVRFAISSSTVTISILRMEPLFVFKRSPRAISSSISLATPRSLSPSCSMPSRAFCIAAPPTVVSVCGARARCSASFSPARPDIVKALRLHNGMLYAAISNEVLVWDVASVTRTVGVQITRPNSPPALHDAFGFAGGDDFGPDNGSASNFGNFGFIGAQSNEAFSDPSLMALTMSFPAPPVERAASVVSPTLQRRAPQPATVVSPTLARRAPQQQQAAAVASPRPQQRNNVPALPPVPRPQLPAPPPAMPAPATGHDRALPALPPDDDNGAAVAPPVSSLSPRIPRPLPRGAPGDVVAVEQRSPPLSPEFTSPVGSPRPEHPRPLPAVAALSPNTLRRPLPTQQPPPTTQPHAMSPPPLERPATQRQLATQPNAPPPLPRPAAHRIAQQQRSQRQQQQQQQQPQEPDFMWDI
jgi:hypothetical protein